MREKCHRRWRGRAATVIAAGLLSAVMAATGVFAAGKFLRTKTYKNNEGIYSTSRVLSTDVPASFGLIAKLSVPKGNQLVIAKLDAGGVSGPSPWYTDCRLEAGGDFDRSAISTNGSTTVLVPMTLTVVHRFGSPGVVRLRCQDLGAESVVQDIKITSIRARSLVNTASP